MKHKNALAAAVAASLGVATGDAYAIGYYVTLTSVTSYSSGGTSAGNVISSTATWFFDKNTHVILQVGGTFNVRFNIVPTTTLFRHSITGLVIGNSAAASATAFTCSDGNFGPNVGGSLCGNYNFGANFIDESTASWGPGTTKARSIGGDDVAIGPQQGLSQYDGFVYGGSTNPFVFSNASCNPLAPGNANGCATLSGKNSGYTWTFNPGNCGNADPSLGPACNLPTPTIVPVPTAVWLFGSALGLIGVMRRKISS